jgi:DNA helicase HerA-like ATPase
MEKDILSKDEETTYESALLEKRIITGIKTTTFKIISKDVREFHFVIPFDNRVELGEIFSIKDNAIKGDEITFLARITDIRHDSNYEGKWDTALKGTEFFDEDQIFNRVIAEPLGCIVFDKKSGKKEFKKSKTIPSKFSDVERARFEEFEILKEKISSDLEVGYLRNGSRVVEEISVGLNSKVMDHHMGVFATTGMGKSNFMKVFAASCMKKASDGTSEFGLLIIDPHGEYLLGNRKKDSKETKGLLHLTKYSDGLKCYSTDKKNAQIPNVVELKLGWNDIKPSDLFARYNDWSTPQKEGILSIERSIKKGSFQGKSWLEKMTDGESVVSSQYKEGTVDVITRRVEDILDLDYIDGDRSNIQEIIASIQMGKVVLIDMHRISERDELFLLSVLSRHILERYKDDDFNHARKNCLITIEEAQRVLGGGDGNVSRFEKIAREGRKFGVGLCAITQQPKLIDKQLLSQFNTLVIMGLGDKNDRKCLEESAKQDLTTLDVEIQTLEKGEAIISTLNVPFPIPATIHLYEEYLERLKEKDHAEGNCTSKARKLSRPPD